METIKVRYIASDISLGRLRLLYRNIRFSIHSLKRGYFDFIWNAIYSIGIIVRNFFADFFLKNQVQCNICGWKGHNFYPNTGSGYFKKETMCPRCLNVGRYRSIIEILEKKTSFFDSSKKCIEVAPSRTLQKFFLEKKKDNYISFDFERFAMEHGDITKMHYPDESCDFFLCLHVLEHIKDEEKALYEIRRVLKPSGMAIIQVPMDSSIDETYEYKMPDPRETNHVRRYGLDFSSRMEKFGFIVDEYTVEGIFSDEEIDYFGLSKDLFFLLNKKNT
ncbi:MAG: class I SAM-dependent methyltransferase [Candidatus Electrothrix sp. MAN1_4]|nr:class I SAM-dependent methyltransferase [Candidatus Electrothrix sp. MAN1_4]